MVFYSMQDKFSAEIELVNKVRCKLVTDSWSIIQLVCSGGQAHFSISYKKNGKIKNVFPDLLAHNDKNIIIGEIKENFDNGDYLKLLDLQDADEALKKLSKVMLMRTGKTFTRKDYLFVLINSEPFPSPVPLISQYVYNCDNDSFCLIHPAI